MTKKKFAVLGKPISHSLSPTIHRAAYEQLGLDWSYDRFEVGEGELKKFLELEGKDLDGLSLTMPLKIEAAQIADVRDALVTNLGIANTLVKQEGKLYAFNTDVFGISQSLAACWKAGVKRVSILGAGATAQSALAAVKENSPEAFVSIYVRNIASTKAIVDLAKKLGLVVAVFNLEGYGNTQDLTINTIPSNDLPIQPSEQSGWLLDANYSSADEKLAGSFDPSRVVTGESMLIWQAIAQIRIFLTGDSSQELPNEGQVLEAMRASL